MRSDHDDDNYSDHDDDHYFDYDVDNHFDHDDDHYFDYDDRHDDIGIGHSSSWMMMTMILVIKEIVFYILIVKISRMIIIVYQHRQ